MTETIVRGEIELPQFPGKILYGPVFQTESEREQLFSELDASGVSVIWNLQERRDSYESEAQHFHAVVWTPVDDYSVPEDADAFVRDLDRVLALLRGGKHVYVHCMAGHGRTGLGLASLLVRLGAPPALALSQVHEVCGGPETEEQKGFVHGIEPESGG